MSTRVELEYNALEMVNWTLVSGVGGSGLATVQMLQQVFDE